MAELVMKAPESTAIAKPMMALTPPEEQPWPVQMKYVYPVQTELIQAGAKGHHLAFVSGGHEDPIVEKALDKPFLITTLQARNLAKFRDGDKVVRAYPNGASDAKYKEYLKRKGETYTTKEGKQEECLQTGYAYVNGLILEDGSAVLAIFETTKTLGPYFYKALATDAFIGDDKSPAKHGIRMNIVDHTPNLTKSAKGYWYPDKKKLKQYEQIELGKEQLELIFAAYKAKQKFVDEFVGK